MADLTGTMEVRVQDDNGIVTPATHYIKVADTATLAQIQTVVTAVLAALDDVTDGKPVKATVTLDFAVSGVKSDPVAESNNQEGGLLTFTVTGAKYPTSLWIPAYLDSLSVQGMIANSGATATYTAYLLGGPYNGLYFADRYGNALAAFKAGRNTFRRFAKQLARAASGGHST